MKEVEIIRGDGVTLFDKDGNIYLDGVSGTFNVALGYAHPKIVSAVTDQVSRVSHVSSHHTKPHIRNLFDMLFAHAPEGITRGWLRDITGSTANEGAIKMAQKATGKKDIITFFLSHHGQTSMTTAISGNAFRREGFPDSSSPNSIKVPPPNCASCFYGAARETCNMKCVDKIDDFIQYASSGSVAAIMIEPVIANGGNIVPPIGYFAALEKFCRERKIAIIADEVHTGMGRCGEIFASKALGLNPDIITLGKGLGGIGIPVAAILMRPEYDVLKNYDHSFTSGGNMLAITAAKETVRTIEEEKILDHVKRLEPVIGAALEKLKSQHSVIKDVRGIGFMWGIELVDENGKDDPALTTDVAALAFDNHNLIIRGTRYGYGNVIEFRPALVAQEHEILEMVNRIGKAITDAVNLKRGNKPESEAHNEGNNLPRPMAVGTHGTRATNDPKPK
jgi:4-aminobutyrate aminotransferase